MGPRSQSSGHRSRRFAEGAGNTRVLAVCGFGVGSSMILKMTMDKAFARLGADVEVENTDINAARGERADAIFASNELCEELEGSVATPVYAVKRYTDLAEVEDVARRFLADRTP